MKWIIRALFFTLFVLVGCRQPGGPSSPAAGAVLQVAARVVSVQVGQQAVLQVTACKPDGSADGISVTCSNGCAAATVNSGGSIRVQGIELGETTVTVCSDSGLRNYLLVRVHDPKALMVGGLALRYTNQFEWRWNTQGSGLSQHGEFMHPIAPEGYYPLGSVGYPEFISPANLGLQFAAIVVKQVGDSGALAAPTDYIQIWSYAWNNPGCFWLPVAPEGYVALGVVVTPNVDTKPGLNEIRCVRSDLVADAKAGAYVWGFDPPPPWPPNVKFGSWQVDPPNVPNAPGKVYLKAGTICAVSSTTSPPASDPALHVLNLKLPRSTDLSDSTYAPVLDSYDEPPTSTDLYLSKVIDVPFPWLSTQPMISLGRSPTRPSTGSRGRSTTTTSTSTTTATAPLRSRTRSPTRSASARPTPRPTG